MGRIARIATQRPRRAIVAWVVAVAALATLGAGVEDRLHRSALVVGGTASAAAERATAERFGAEQDLVVLLRGPRAARARQGGALTRSLTTISGVEVARPSGPGVPRGSTVLLVRARGSFERASREVAPAVRGHIGEVVRSPVSAHVSGYADIGAGLHQRTVDAIHRAESLAAPILLLVLLLVFRTVVAAVVPLAVGLGTVGATTGVLGVVNDATPLDALALNMASMMGLALGVDYSLLLVSRFREELRAGRSVERAVGIAVQRAGHTVWSAALALVAVMATAFLIAPGDLLSSAVVGITTAVVLALLSSLVLVPAALVLLGRRVDRLAVPLPRAGGPGLAALSSRLLGRPAAAIAVVAVTVGVLAAPGLALDTGPPDPALLPADAQQRIDYEAIRAELGPGWTVPLRVTVARDRGPVTDRASLRTIARWEAGIARSPRVAAVFGPGPLAERTDEIDRVPDRIEDARGAVAAAVRDGRSLARGLTDAGAGVAEVRAGLDTAAAGAGVLRTGGGRAAEGAARVRTGIDRAVAGLDPLRRGMREARSGTRRLADGSRDLAGAADALADGLRRATSGARRALEGASGLADGLRAGTDDLGRLDAPVDRMQQELAVAADALDAMLPTSKLDPRFRQARVAVATAQSAMSGRREDDGSVLEPGYDGLAAALRDARAGSGRAAEAATAAVGGLRRLTDGVVTLRSGARRLATGGRRLHTGADDLLDGLRRLDAGRGELARGLRRLAAGGGDLSTGLRRLDTSAGLLADGLADGARRAAPLADGVGRLREGVREAGAQTRRVADDRQETDRLAAATRSGHFVLAALDAGGAADRTAAGFAVNLDRGGGAAQVTVIGRGADLSRAGHPLRAELEREGRALGEALGATVSVGGPAAILQDFDERTSGRFVPLIVALSLVSLLVLSRVLRSWVLAAIGVGLNLLTVGAAFGVLVLLFQGDSPVGGGPGWLDAIGAVGVFAVVFALSIDYQLFLLARMREVYDATGSVDDAIRDSLRTTAPVVVGAALVMAAVFAVFATGDMVSIRQLGIGLTVAIVLDATLIRLVLLPACIRLVGDRAFGRRAPLAPHPAPGGAA